MAAEIRDICKSYKDKAVLKNVSFKAEDGTVISLVGANGSGKSTLLQIMAGILKPDSGSFVIDTKEVTSGRTDPRVSYVPQTNPLIEELNAMDNLLLWHDKKTIRDSLETGILKRLKIDTFIKTPVSKMSQGMKKRLAVGCAVLKDFKILLLDEPCASLDMPCKELLYGLYRDLAKEGKIIIIVTHDEGEIALSDRCLIFKDQSVREYTKDRDHETLVEELKNNETGHI